MALEVSLQWTNHRAKELMKRSVLHITDPASLFVDRDQGTHDASSRPPEGAREVFSQEVICEVWRATTWSPQACRGQTSCSYNSRVGGALSLGFESDTPSTANILHVCARPLGLSPVAGHDLPMDLGRQQIGSE